MYILTFYLSPSVNTNLLESKQNEAQRERERERVKAYYMFKIKIKNYLKRKLIENFDKLIDESEDMS